MKRVLLYGGQLSYLGEISVLGCVIKWPPGIYQGGLFINVRALIENTSIL